MNCTLDAHRIITEHNTISDNQYVIGILETTDDEILKKVNSEHKYCLLVLCSTCDSEENYKNILFMYGKDMVTERYQFINKIDIKLCDTLSIYKIN